MRQHLVQLRVLGAVEQRVAVGGRVVDEVGRDRAGAAGLVDEHDLLAQRLLGVRRDRARDDVRRTARAPHDDAGELTFGKRRRRAHAGEQGQGSGPEKLPVRHGVPPFLDGYINMRSGSGPASSSGKCRESRLHRDFKPGSRRRADAAAIAAVIATSTTAPSSRGTSRGEHGLAGSVAMNADLSPRPHSRGSSFPTRGTRSAVGRHLSCS